MNNKLLLAALIILGSNYIFGQEQTETPNGREIISLPKQAAPSNSEESKQISGGVLNDKATSLPKPAYPAEARAKNVKGAVAVQVVVDEEGKVVSARAVSGDPLLRSVSEDAARGAVFSPTRLSGEPIKITGIIIYNFGDLPIGTKIVFAGNWVNTGMMLATLEMSPTLRYFQPDAVAHMIPQDWAEEHRQLTRLGELKQAELEASFGEKPRERRLDDRNVAITVSPLKTSSPEDAAIGQSLLASIKGRLGGRPLDLWYFNLGIEINRALYKADSVSKSDRMSTVGPFKDFIATAPADVPAGIVEELQNMYALMEKGVFTDSDKIALGKSMAKVLSAVGMQ